MCWARPEAANSDICCGTGDLTVALLKLRPRRSTGGSARSISGSSPRSALLRPIRICLPTSGIRRSEA